MVLDDIPTFIYSYEDMRRIFPEYLKLKKFDLRNERVIQHICMTRVAGNIITTNAVFPNYVPKMQIMHHVAVIKGFMEAYPRFSERFHMQEILDNFVEKMHLSQEEVDAVKGNFPEPKTQAYYDGFEYHVDLNSLHRKIQETELTKENLMQLCTGLKRQLDSKDSQILSLQFELTKCKNTDAEYESIILKRENKKLLNLIKTREITINSLQTDLSKTKDLALERKMELHKLKIDPIRKKISELEKENKALIKKNNELQAIKRLPADVRKENNWLRGYLNTWKDKFASLYNEHTELKHKFEDTYDELSDLRKENAKLKQSQQLFRIVVNK